jgi:hypothetical protein
MDPDSGGLKTCGSCGSGSPTLRKSLTYYIYVWGGKHPVRKRLKFDVLEEIPKI